MKPKHYLRHLLVLTLAAFMLQAVYGQSSSVKDIFPEGTLIHNDIPYANDTLNKHLLDIYLPEKVTKDLPLVVWIHGGAWMMNDKHADMGYMRNTVKGFIENGYVLASINYRYSTEAIFPAQLQDCNQAIEFLYQHAAQYHIDKNRIAVIGFSAGGHLASLLGLSANNNVKDFYPGGSSPHFKIKCVLDFYGPSDLIAMASRPDTSATPGRDPVSILLGHTPIERPDVARKASPVSYVDEDDPPFFIVQGEKDESVPNTQSRLLSSWLTVTGVKNQLTVVPGAPHFGKMFDADDIRLKLFDFLNGYMK